MTEQKLQQGLIYQREIKDLQIRIDTLMKFEVTIPPYNIQHRNILWEWIADYREQIISITEKIERL